MLILILGGTIITVSLITYAYLLETNRTLKRASQSLKNDLADLQHKNAILKQKNDQMYDFIKNNYKQEVIHTHRDQLNRYKVKEKASFYKRMAKECGISADELSKEITNLSVIDGGKK